MVIYVSVAHGSPGWSCNYVAVAGTRGGEGGRRGGWRGRGGPFGMGTRNVLWPGQGKDGEPLCRVCLQICILREKFHVEMPSRASTKSN